MDDFFASVASHWPTGREDYHWHVLPGTELARDRIARPYAELISQPGLAPVRPEFMHVTVQRLPPVSDITEGDLDGMARLVREACTGIAPFAVTAGRAEAWETSVVCLLRPGYLLASLRQVVVGAARTVTGSRPGADPAAYHPHLALAYATGHVDQDRVRAWLADCDAAEAPLPVTRLTLVAQRHDGREITFRVIDQIPLGG